MGQVIERRNLHPKNIDLFLQPSHELQLHGSVSGVLNREMEERTRELRHMRGEDLEELDIEELQILEKLIEGSLCRVVEKKGNKLINEIDALKTKGEELVKENQRLKEQVMNLSAGQGHLLEPGAQSSDSMATNMISTMSSADHAHQDYDSFSAFLTLGLPFPD